MQRAHGIPRYKPVLCGLATRGDLTLGLRARSFHRRFATSESPYEVLGVSRGASSTDIRSAFLKAAKKHHPDANPNDPTAARRFNEVSDAYNMLTDKVKPSLHSAGDAKFSREAVLTMRFCAALFLGYSFFSNQPSIIVR